MTGGLLSSFFLCEKRLLFFGEEGGGGVSLMGMMVIWKSAYSESEVVKMFRTLRRSSSNL